MKIRRPRNQIEKIQVEGQEIRGIEEIKKEAHNHYKNLLSASHQQVDSEEFLQQIKKKISEQQNRDLDKEVTEEEIREAVWSLHPEKALGLDGFTIAFYRNHWETIKKDLVRMIKNVFKKYKVGGNTKASFLVLIPKESNPISLDRYRPISLCNSSYKIITKILANRLKKNSAIHHRKKSRWFRTKNANY